MNNAKVLTAPVLDETGFDLDALSHDQLAQIVFAAARQLEELVQSPVPAKANAGTNDASAGGVGQNDSEKPYLPQVAESIERCFRWLSRARTVSVHRLVAEFMQPDRRESVLGIPATASYFPNGVAYASAIMNLPRKTAFRLSQTAPKIYGVINEKGETTQPTFSRLAAEVEAGEIGAESTEQLIQTINQSRKILRDADFNEVEIEDILGEAADELLNAALEATPDEFRKLTTRRLKNLRNQVVRDDVPLTKKQQTSMTGLKPVGKVGEDHFKWEWIIDAEGDEILRNRQLEVSSPRNADNRMDDEERERFRARRAKIEQSDPNNFFGVMTAAQKLSAAIFASMLLEPLDNGRKTYRRRPEISYTISAEVYEGKAQPDAPVDILTGTARNTSHSAIGGPAPPERIREIGCRANFTPIWTDANRPGKALDVGRSQRAFSEAMLKAIRLRDGGCVVPGCEMSEAYCEGHHIEEFQHGGVTSVDNGALVCGPHHRAIHAGEIRLRLNKEKYRVECIPAEHIDPTRTARINKVFRD